MLNEIVLSMSARFYNQTELSSTDFNSLDDLLLEHNPEKSFHHIYSLDHLSSILQDDKPWDNLTFKEKGLEIYSRGPKLRLGHFQGIREVGRKAWSKRFPAKVYSLSLESFLKPFKFNTKSIRIIPRDTPANYIIFWVYLMCPCFHKNKIRLEFIFTVFSPNLLYFNLLYFISCLSVLLPESSDTCPSSVTHPPGCSVLLSLSKQSKEYYLFQFIF